MLADLLNLIYPNLCECCGHILTKGERVLCCICRYQLPRTNYWIQKDNPVEQIFLGRVRIENACSLFFMNKGTPYRKLLHKLKYSNKPRIGVELGAMLGIVLQETLLYSDVDAIIPIPLHSKRQRKRGYNQSEQIAMGIAQTFGKEFITTAVKRQYYNETQTKKTREERMQNVKNVFSVVHPEILENKHILLVDDVVTTGATIEACIATIQNHVMSCRVSVATLAVALKN
ncbi:MAG: ComF family protein [Bacteroidales bacterium]